MSEVPSFSIGAGHNEMIAKLVWLTSRKRNTMLLSAQAMAAWAECTKKIQIFWNVCSLPLHSRLGVASTFSRDYERDVR